MFSWSLDDFMPVLFSHGIQPSTLSMTHARLTLLDHVLHGKCFLPTHGSSVTHLLCDHNRMSFASSKAMTVDLINSVLCSDCPADCLHDMCSVLGMTHRELNAVRSLIDLHTYLEHCRDDFASALDAAAVLCDIESMNLHQLLLMTQMHNLPSDDCLTVEQHCSRLVQHLCREGCELVVPSNEVPRCHDVNGDSSDDLVLTLIDTVLQRKIKAKPARCMLTSLGSHSTRLN
jgi:hypothetical protein